MGFEYGYSVARPEALTLWEAQFGDFANGAQTIIDEFIVAGEAKWQQQSGVVMLLPHGYEGQGPDHSSARIERFLTLAADDAFTVAQPSTPASYFHLLRQHSLGSTHRPMVVFTPKSMLKRKDAASAPEDFTSGTFRPVIGDDEVDPASVRVLLLCSGRITWDLFAERKKRGRRRPSSPSPGSSSSTRARSTRSRRRSPSTPTSRRSAGCRTSRPTWARGRFLALNLGPELDLTCRSPACRGRRPRHRRAARRRSTCSSWRRSSTGPSPEPADDVLHRPRDRGAGRSVGATRRSRSRGWPSGSRSSST